MPRWKPQEYERKVDKWVEERTESLSIGIGNNSDLPSFLARAGSDADGIDMMKDALKQAESDSAIRL